MHHKSLAEVVTKTARRNPQAVAIVYGNTTITYGRFIEAVDRLASGLHGLGLRRGDRMALMLPNLPHFAISYYALLKLGVRIIPLNIMFKEAEIQYILEDCEASGFIAWEHFSRPLMKVAANLDRCRLQIFLGDNLPSGSVDLTRLLNTATVLAPESVPAEEIAVIHYTAGTTGHPKGAMLSHENLLASIAGCREALLVTSEDCLAAVLPLFHSFGQIVGMHLPLVSGASLVMHTKFEPAVILDSLEQDRVSIFPGVPGMFEQLLQQKPPKEKFSALKFCVASGAPLSQRVHNEMLNRYGVTVLAGYGLSECSPLATVQQPFSEHRQGSVGMPLPGLEVRLLGSDGNELTHGDVGEITLRGAATMRGYLNRSEATKEVLRDGWLLTGDVGYLDAEGYLYVIDRKKDLILKAGFNVYPREVEDLINTHPKVEECAVIGVPDKYQGEEVKAFVVLRQGQHASKEELIQYCREKMAAYKCPKHVEFCGELPRGATGKVLKRLLREKKPGGAMPSAALPINERLDTMRSAAPSPVATVKAEPVSAPASISSDGESPPQKMAGEAATRNGQTSDMPSSSAQEQLSQPE